MEGSEHRPLQVEGTPYALLRHLTLPVVAVTSSLNGRGNGMIANGVQRASLIPTQPRVSLYINRTNLTHEIVYRTGALAVHLLRRDQFELIYDLGFRSGREHDKLRDVETVSGETGVPLLVDCIAAFDCRVVNAMHAGAATFFLADVVEVREGRGGPVMTSEFFRENLPADRLRQYETLLVEAQEKLLHMDTAIERGSVWTGPTDAVR